MTSPIAVWVPLSGTTVIRVSSVSGICSGGTICGSLGPLNLNRTMIHECINDRFLYQGDVDPEPETGSILGLGVQSAGLLSAYIAGRINETPFRCLYLPGEDVKPYGEDPLNHPFAWAMDEYWVDMLFDIGSVSMAAWDIATFGGNKIQIGSTTAAVDSNQEPGWGCSLAARAMWDPTIRFVDGNDADDDDRPVGYEDRPALVAKTTRDSYTLAQWPFGTDDATNFLAAENNEMSIRTTTKPCWILSNDPRPFADIASASNYPIAVAGSQITFVGSVNTSFDGYQIEHQALFWFMPEDGEHYNHHYFANWNDLVPVDVDASSNFFMGKPQFADPNKAGKNAGIGNDFQSNFDRDTYWNEFFGSWYNNSEMTSFSADYPYDDAESEFAYPHRTFPGFGLGFGASGVYQSDEWNTVNPYTCPHVGLDSEFRLPYIEFDRPSKLDTLPEGTTLDSATAEVYVSSTARVEFDVHQYYEPQKNAGSVPVYTARFPVTGGSNPLSLPTNDKFGWHVKQKSNEPVGAEVSDDREEYVDVHRFIAHWTASGSVIESSTNTHYKYDEYEAIVLSEGGTAPTNSTEPYYENPPNCIPKSEPWFPSGDSRLSAGPQDVNALVGLRMNLALVGMQPQKEVLNGVSVSTDLTVTRTIKEMERNIIWHHNDFLYDGEWNLEVVPFGTYTLGFPFTDYAYQGGSIAWKWYLSYATSTDYLSDLRNDSHVSEYVGDLKDYRYRYVSRCEPRVDTANGRDEVIFPDQWETVNLDSLFTAMLGDTARTANNEKGEVFTLRHTKYRIMPCGPGTLHQSSLMQIGGEWANIAPIFMSMLPTSIGFPADQDDPSLGVNATNESWQIYYGDLNYQKFSEFKIRNIVARFTTPTGEKVIVRISTEWDG